jgi:ABC-type transport system substrate-binding protein
MWYWKRFPSRAFPVISILALVLLLGVACGSAAPPAAEPADTSTEPQSTAQPTTAPVSDAQPTSAPASAEVAVHPGKLTWMVGGWGSANFDYTYDVGGSNNYLRFFSAFLVETNEKTELIPGIASEWGVSPDGKTWTVTVRDGVKFHDGTPVTAEDVLWT